MARMSATIRSYGDAVRFLNGAKSRKLGHNTWVEDCGDSVSIFYHQTEIVRYYSTGEIQLDSGGWRSVTTKQRLSACSPFQVYSEGNGDWAVRTGRERNGGDSAQFEDGMTSDADGRWQGHKARVGAAQP
jgi:hypothetical protein